GIYSGTITLKDLNVSISIELLLASDLLLLHDFLDFLKVELLERNKTHWKDDEILYMLNVSYRIPSRYDLYLVCQDMVAERPVILFGSPEFLSIDEDLLLSILKLDMICLPEQSIFDNLIRWGIANTPNYSTITDKTSRFNALGTTLEDALQLIRYDNIKGSIIEYEQILPDKVVLYKIPPRSNYIVEPKGPSLMIMKLKNSGKFIGAYNPIQWKQGSSSCCGSTSESFIFTYDDKYGSNYRLCRVKNFDHAVCLVSDFGGLLNFGEDLMFKFDKETVRCHIKCKFYDQTTLAGSTNSPVESKIVIANHHEPSLMLMKLKNGKIVGAYNPLDWTYGSYRVYPIGIEYRYTSDSFIFSYDAGVNDGVNYRLSRVVNFDEAIASEKISTNRKDLNGLILRFGNDLRFIHNGSGRRNVPDRVFCHIEQNGHYEQPAIIPSGNYEIDQWEIFRVSRKDPEALL
ncbi:17696_t:CDS:2, partial [Racocetra fulgida]